jgi:hypothetical protein
MTDITTTPPAGWYPDPRGIHSERYWDGERWTERCYGKLPKEIREHRAAERNANFAMTCQTVADKSGWADKDGNPTAGTKVYIGVSVVLAIILGVLTFPVGILAGPLLFGLMMVPVKNNTNMFPDPVKSEPAAIESGQRSRHISQATKIAVLKRDGFACQDCGTEDDIQFDHDIPWSLGGSNEPNNIIVRCGPCNRRKGNKII